MSTTRQFHRHTRRPIHLILDFDGTLTQKDTTTLVGQIGYDRHRSLLQHQQNNDPATPSVPPWSEFLDAYMSDYTTHSSTYLPQTADRCTVYAERHWLASLATMEQASAERVQASGLFDHISTQDVSRTVSHVVDNGEVKLRRGWEELFRLCAPEDEETAARKHFHVVDHVSILSVNWSATFIRSALRACIAHEYSRDPLPETKEATSERRHQRLDDLVAQMEIRANEIPSLVSSAPDPIRTSADKLAHLPPHCIARLDSVSLSSTSPATTTAADPAALDPPPTGPYVIYIGDSTTDLECLLAADMGICIRGDSDPSSSSSSPSLSVPDPTRPHSTASPSSSSQRELADTLTRLGVSVPHITEFAKNVADAQCGDEVVLAPDDPSSETAAAAAAAAAAKAVEKSTTSASLLILDGEDMGAKTKRKRDNVFWARDSGEVADMLLSGTSHGYL